MNKKFYTQEEVKQILNASDSSLLRWRKENEIPEPVKIGRKILGWPIIQFDEWFKTKMAY
jgi:predicted DNA-binding transcriptional regulator AlpA